MNEKAIVKKIVAAIKRRGAYVIKTHGSPALAGVPDLLVCYKGFFVALEVKTPKTQNNLSPRQRHSIAMISEAGGVAAVVWTVDQATQLLDYIDRGFLTLEQ